MYKLKNKYLLMRHAESMANREGIIISDPNVGVVDFGLTDEGVQSVATQALNTRLDSTAIIYCSDFLRTHQTASIMADVLDARSPTIATELRERFFGKWEGSSSENYDLVWKQDLLNSYPNEVEPIPDVLNRTVGFVLGLEKRHSNETIMLVSHGDSLQILLSWFKGTPAIEHRSLAMMKPANIRQLMCMRSLQEIEAVSSIAKELTAA